MRQNDGRQGALPLDRLCFEPKKINQGQVQPSTWTDKRGDSSGNPYGGQDERDKSERLQQFAAGKLKMGEKIRNGQADQQGKEGGE